MMRKRLEESDMFAFLGINNNDESGDGIRTRRKIRNADEVLSLLSTI
jgi:hypothetical protein